MRPEIVWGRLPNGIRYVVWPLANQQNVSLRLLVEAGSLNETDAEQGLAHFLEHMAFKGSENLPPGTMVSELQRLGLAFGTHNNAATSFDRTWYKLDMRSGEIAHVDRGLAMLRETADRLTLAADQMETERSVILAEIRVRDRPGQRELQATYDLIFGDWFSKHWPNGSREVIEHAQRDDLLVFYRRWYRPERMVVVAAGGLDPIVAERLIRARFADVPMPKQDPVPDPPFPPLPHRASTIRLLEEPSGNLTVALLTAQPLDHWRDDFAGREQQAARDLALYMLKRRLAVRAGTKDANYSVKRIVSAQEFGRARVGIIELTTQQAHWRSTVAAAEQELRRALTFGFNASELAEAKAVLRKGWEQALAQESAVSPALAAEAIVAAVRNDQVVNALGPVVQRLDNIVASMEADMPQQALRALWSDHEWCWLLSGPIGNDMTQASVAAAIRDSEQVVVDAPKDRKDVAFAYERFGEPGAVIRRDEVRPGLTIATFENQTRAVLVPSKGAVDRVQIALDIHGGGWLGQPQDQPGLAYVSKLYFLGGLEAHSAAAVGRLLRLHGMQLGFEMNYTRLQLTLSAPRNELPLALRILTAYLAAPGFRDDAFALTMRRVDRIAETVGATPETVIAHSLPTRRCAGDSRCSGVTDWSVLRQRKKQEVKDWLAPVLRESAVSVTIVGPLDVDATLKELAASIGALPRRAPVPNGRATEVELPALAEGAVETLTYAGEGAAYVVVEFPMGGPQDHPRWTKQSLLAQLFQERLRNRLRSRAGESYMVTVTMHGASEVRPSWLSVQVDARPERARAIGSIVADVAAEVATKPFTTEEMSEVRPVVLRQTDTYFKNDSVMLAILRGKPDPAATWDQTQQTRSVIEGATVDEVNVLARDILRADAARTYLIVPGPKSPKPQQRPPSESGTDEDADTSLTPPVPRAP